MISGGRFVEICGYRELVIGQLYSRTKCAKETWNSPNGMVANQIDHIAVSRMWRRSLMNVRSRRGADCGSVHHLVIADMRLKVAFTGIQLEKRQTLFDSDKLRKKEVAHMFSLELQNRFTALDTSG